MRTSEFELLKNIWLFTFISITLLDMDMECVDTVDDNVSFSETNRTEVDLINSSPSLKILNHQSYSSISKSLDCCCINTARILKSLNNETAVRCTPL